VRSIKEENSDQELRGAVRRGSEAHGQISQDAAARVRVNCFA